MSRSHSVRLGSVAVVHVFELAARLLLSLLRHHGLHVLRERGSLLVCVPISEVLCQRTTWAVRDSTIASARF